MNVTEKNIRNKLAEYYPNAKKTTLDSYFYSYRKLCRQGFSKEPHQIKQEDINQIERVISALEQNPPTSAKVYSNCLMKCIKCFFPETDADVVGARSSSIISLWPPPSEGVVEGAAGGADPGAVVPGGALRGGERAGLARADASRSGVGGECDICLELCGTYLSGAPALQLGSARRPPPPSLTRV